MHAPLLPLLLLLLLASLPSSAQSPRYVIHFIDKHNSPYRLEAPSAYLSPRALERRNRQHIPIDSSDLPVNPHYIDSLLAAGNVQLLYTLRWFNQAVIRTDDAAALQKIAALPFVKSVSEGGMRLTSGQSAPVRPKFREEQASLQAAVQRTADQHYGAGQTQIQLHEGAYLHNKQLLGQGMLIALLDEGFTAVDQNRAFAALRDRQQIIATRNFSNGGADVYGYGDHGAHCLSILAANLPGVLTGAAPDANYMLLRTEEDGAEHPIEESNWVAAAELADSIGADVISSSLGYNTFDNPIYNHTYAQLDGRTTTVAKAAALAARKGMIVVNSIGNEGNSDWQYLLSPADADSILAVGGVNSQGQVAGFSGYGPAADGRIKPDVAALGTGVALVNTAGEVITGNGTSYACPVIAGLVTCLWQAFPGRSGQEIIQVVKAVSHRYSNPDNRIGYGIPNFRAAYDTLQQMEERDTAYIQRQLGNASMKAFPNPFTNQLKVFYRTLSAPPAHLQLIDAAGRMVATWRLAAAESYGYFNWQNGLERLPNGIYYLRLVQGKEKQVVKLLKQ